MQHSEPIFQVPGVRNAIVLKVMKLMQRDRDWLSCRQQAKDFPLVSPDHLRPHTCAIGLCDHVVNDDLQVGKRSKEHLHQRLHALRTRSLTGRKRNVLPIRGHGFVEKAEGWGFYR